MLRTAFGWRRAEGSRIVPLGLYLGALAAVFAAAAHGAGQLASMALSMAPKPGVAPAATVTPEAKTDLSQSRTEGTVTLAQSSWGGPRRSEWGARERRRSRDKWDEPERDEEDAHYDEEAPPERFGGTYRTVCVRLCDGFYWPISYATTPENFGRDQRKCASSCGSPVRLYAYRNPGGALESMEDLNGRPYSALKTAFLYRIQYNESCKCKSDPWEQASLDRHRMYALEAAKRKGDKVAARELDLLKANMEEQRVATLRANGGKVAAGAGAIAEPGASIGDDGARVPAQSERMSLGGRSAAPKSAVRPARIWRNTADNAP